MMALQCSLLTIHSPSTQLTLAHTETEGMQGQADSERLREVEMEGRLLEETFACSSEPAGHADAVYETKTISCIAIIKGGVLSGESLGL